MIFLANKKTVDTPPPANWDDIYHILDQKSRKVRAEGAFLPDMLCLTYLLFSRNKPLKIKANRRKKIEFDIEFVYMIIYHV